MKNIRRLVSEYRALAQSASHKHWLEVEHALEKLTAAAFAADGDRVMEFAQVVVSESRKAKHDGEIEDVLERISREIDKTDHLIITEPEQLAELFEGYGIKLQDGLASGRPIRTDFARQLARSYANELMESESYE